jgi:hypothetical protein
MLSRIKYENERVRFGKFVEYCQGAVSKLDVNIAKKVLIKPESAKPVPLEKWSEKYNEEEIKQTCWLAEVEKKYEIIQEKLKNTIIQK